MIPRRLLRDSGLTLVFNIAGVALSTLAAIMLARILSLGEFGAYGFAQSVAHVTMVIATMGLPLAASRLVPEFAAKGETARLRGFVVVGLVIVTVAPLLAALLVAVAATALPDGTLRAVLHSVVLVPAVLTVSWQRFVLDVLRASGRPVLAAFLDGPGQRGLWCLSTLALWADGVSLDAATVVLTYAASALAVTLFAGVMIIRTIGRNRVARSDRADVRAWTRLGRHMMATPVFYLVLSEADIVLLGLIASPEAVGLYNVARRIAELLKFFYTATTTVSMPQFARSHAEGRPADLQRAVTAAAVLSLVPSLVFMGIIVVFGRELLELFGAQFVPAYSLLVLMAAIKMADPVLGPVTEVMLMSGLHARTTGVNVVYGATAIMLNLVLIPPFGAHGAAAATGLTFLAWKTTLYVILRRARGPETCLVVAVGRHLLRAA
jgi:O-antigen/teichoic acid export membrane protein